MTEVNSGQINATPPAPTTVKSAKRGRLNGYHVRNTRRSRAPGAEEWLGIPIEVLDHGFLYLVDYMGNDVSIEQAARVSYGSGTRKVSKTRGLIRYLRRHDHTTPFEMVEVKFHAKMPIFVARQWVRHRTASLNEYSGRYSKMPSEFYIPNREHVLTQSKTNNQGRSDELVDDVDTVVDWLKMDAQQAYEHYSNMLEKDVSREIARTNLPVSNYTEWYWKIDLHNLMHFLGLRLDEHAQWEIRQYAKAMEEIIADAFPLAYEAFQDYHMYAEKLTRPEMEVLARFLEGIHLGEGNALVEVVQSEGLSRREAEEFVEKLDKIGLVLNESDN